MGPLLAVFRTSTIWRIIAHQTGCYQGAKTVVGWKF